MQEYFHKIKKQNNTGKDTALPPLSFDPTDSQTPLQYRLQHFCVLQVQLTAAYIHIHRTVCVSFFTKYPVLTANDKRTVTTGPTESSSRFLKLLIQVSILTASHTYRQTCQVLCLSPREIFQISSNTSHAYYMSCPSHPNTTKGKVWFMYALCRTVFSTWALTLCSLLTARRHSH